MTLLLKEGKIKTFPYALLVIVFFPLGCSQGPEPLAKFFKDNRYNLIYPLDDRPAPGAIYEETKDKGLGRPLAYKETCANDLIPVPGTISFGTRNATSETGIKFLLGLSQQLVPIKANLEGAFKKEVSYTVTSDEMDTLSCDWVTLRRYVKEKVPPGDCQDALRKDNAVVLSNVAATRRFTFKFKGLKSGGIDIILQSFIGARLKAEKKDEETIVLEYDSPMKLCYQRWTPEELGIHKAALTLGKIPLEGLAPEPKFPQDIMEKEVLHKVLTREGLVSSTLKLPSPLGKCPICGAPLVSYRYGLMHLKLPPHSTLRLNAFTKEFFGIKE